MLLFILITSLLTVMGQETSDKKKQEADAKRKQEHMTIIVDKANKDAQSDLKKAMEASLAAEEKALQSVKEKGLLNEKDYQKQAQALEDYKKKLQELKTLPELTVPSYNWSYTNPSIRMKTPEGIPITNYGFYRGERENNSLSISKTLEEVTFSTEFTYEVKEGVFSVSFFVNGTMKAGELKITLQKPDKTAFQEFTISPLADVNWTQQFRWEEEESGDYLGKWNISISASKASGNYQVQVNSR